MKRLAEFFNTAAIQLAQPIEVTTKDKSILKKIKWEDIQVLDPDESGDIFNMNFNVKGVEIGSSIIFTIQIRPNGLYKVQNIEIYEGLRGLGLGYKIYRAVLEEFGQLYSPASGRHNDVQVPKIRKALEKDPKIDVFKKGNDFLFLHVDNPVYNEVKEAFLN